MLSNDTKSGFDELVAGFNGVLYMLGTAQLRDMLKAVKQANSDDLPPAVWTARQFFSLKIKSELDARDRRLKNCFARHGYPKNHCEG